MPCYPQIVVHFVGGGRNVGSGEIVLPIRSLVIVVVLTPVDWRQPGQKKGLFRRLSHGGITRCNPVNCPHNCLSVSFVNGRAED